MPATRSVPRVGPQQGGDGADERGLAGAVRAEQGGDPAGLGDEVEPVEGVDVAEVLGEAGASMIGAMGCSWEGGGGCDGGRTVRERRNCAVVERSYGGRGLIVRRGSDSQVGLGERSSVRSHGTGSSP